MAKQSSFTRCKLVFSANFPCHTLAADVFQHAAKDALTKTRRDNSALLLKADDSTQVTAAEDFINPALNVAGLLKAAA
ncbi:MAG TPA: hypothetical protein PK129_13180 [Cellvibrionaceae bacterium]|nr:hypothetical protein [Cellvibrionaceae bacterium]